MPRSRQRKKQEGITCPQCGSCDTRILESRRMQSGQQRRRRECQGCYHRVTTYEAIIVNESSYSFLQSKVNELEWLAKLVSDRRTTNLLRHLVDFAEASRRGEMEREEDFNDGNVNQA